MHFVPPDMAWRYQYQNHRNRNVPLREEFIVCVCVPCHRFRNVPIEIVMNLNAVYLPEARQCLLVQCHMLHTGFVPLGPLPNPPVDGVIR